MSLDEEVLRFRRKKPEKWSMMNIILILKSGDLSKGNNYRGIMFSSVVEKTYT